MPRALALLLIGALALAMERQIVADPRLALDWLPDRPSQQAWRALFDQHATWPERDVDLIAGAHPQRLATLWAARLWYRGEPWTRRENEPVNLRRWRASDRAVRLAILRDLRWRSDPALAAVVQGFLAREGEDAGLVTSALAALWRLDAAAARAAALRLADPRRQDRLPGAGLPTARSFALALLLDIAPQEAELRPAIAWALLTAEGSERQAALARLPRGHSPELVASLLQQLAERERWRDDELDAGVLACTRLDGPLGERGARALAALAARAPRALACAAATAFARLVTWQDAVDPAPLLERLRQEPDPAVRHALAAVLLRIAPARLRAAQAGDAWTALSQHRLALQEWEWQPP